jgi:hypothetical protein
MHKHKQRGYGVDYVTPLIAAGVVVGLLLPLAWKWAIKPALVWLLQLLTGA